MVDESTTPLWITTCISVLLVIFENYIAHSNCPSNSTLQLLTAHLRGCKSVNEAQEIPYPTPPPHIDNGGTDV